MDDKLSSLILSELYEIKRMIADSGLSPPWKADSPGGATWRITATDEEAREFSKKKGVERRRAKR